MRVHVDVSVHVPVHVQILRELHPLIVDVRDESAKGGAEHGDWLNCIRKRLEPIGVECVIHHARYIFEDEVVKVTDECVKTLKVTELMMDQFEQFLFSRR